MHQFPIQKITLGILALLCALTSVEAAHSPKNEVSEWVNSCPYIGLVSNKITYGPVTLKSLDLAESGKVIIAEPNEEIDGTVKYQVASDKLDTLKFHHIIIGLKEEGSQKCLTHVAGIWDAKGKASFTLTAPSKKGVYEVLFDCETALTCGDAVDQWNQNPPSSSAVVGFIIVK